MRLMLSAILLVVPMHAEAVGAAEGNGPPSLTLATTGRVETIFDHGKQACEKLDYPDAPARAVRLSDGNGPVVRDPLHRPPDGGSGPAPSRARLPAWCSGARRTTFRRTSTTGNGSHP